jgi:hypothetical protein
MRSRSEFGRVSVLVRVLVLLPADVALPWGVDAALPSSL